VNPWRLIALDMDGTTLTRDGKISEENQTWIQAARKAGVEVTFATGRHMNGVVRDFMVEMKFEMPVVTVNGGEVWTSDGQLLARHAFPEADIQSLFEMARGYGLSYWGATIDKMMPMEAFPAKVEGEDWLKFGMFGQDPELIRAVWAELKHDNRFEISNSHALNIEINPSGVNKALGLQTVCNHLGIEPKQVVTMGDGMNDVAMLQWAGLGIAMGNAQDAVKKVADVTTANFDEDGVAQAIRKYVLA
jgi:5-amino-6-(5-phospho-D-ribitylamino)uracil phosphatase